MRASGWRPIQTFCDEPLAGAGGRCAAAVIRVGSVKFGLYGLHKGENTVPEALGACQLVLPRHLSFWPR